VKYTYFEESDLLTPDWYQKVRKVMEKRKRRRMFRKLAVTTQNQWVTYLLNALALIIMIGNYLLSTPVFPKEWTIWAALIVGLANVIVEWLSKLPIDA
jgi:hypothetical protein